MKILQKMLKQDFGKGRPLPESKNKILIRLIKDELGGPVMKEFGSD